MKLPSCAGAEEERWGWGTKFWGSITGWLFLTERSEIDVVPGTSRVVIFEEFNHFTYNHGTKINNCDVL